MNIADELRKLQELHSKGALTDEEFAKAKAEILDGRSHSQSPVGEVRPLFSIDPYDSLTARLLRTMQIVAGTLLMGVVVFVGIALYLVLVQHNGQGIAAPPNPNLPALSVLAVAMLGINATLAFVIPRRLTRLALRRILSGTWPIRPGIPPTTYATGRAKLMALLQTEMIVGLALLEGSAFLGCTAYMLEAQTLILGVPAVVVVLMVCRFPTEGRVRGWLVRQAEMLNELRQQEESAVNL
jgi:hypothetical protein